MAPCFERYCAWRRHRRIFVDHLGDIMLEALVVLIFAGALPSADQTLVKDTHTPRGIAFDEIARLLPPGTPPPSVGTFAADAAAIAALPP